MNAEARSLELHYEESLEVARRYERWRDLEQRFEASIDEEKEETEISRRRRFARQCAYVLFLRVLLVRILEDKKLLRQRLITDGGLALWLETVRRRFGRHASDLSSAPLIDLALGQAEAVSGSLHRRDIYEWYLPDDASVLDILEVLHGYDFSRLATDVIGYTYQRFLEKTEQHRLGHYLTPPAVIDHILDVAGYVGSNLEIIGRTVFDPACGSGSFLVHAAVRYRQALNSAYPSDERGAARAFVQAVQEHFIGIDINTFSCYLARINLLVQVLDDIALLHDEHLALGELAIHNADLVITRTENQLIQIRGGGMGSDSAEAIRDVERRPVIDIAAERIRVWVSPSRIPVTGPTTMPSADPWLLLFPVMPERQDYYALWDTLCSNSNQTVEQLFDRVGQPLGNVMRQGDVNTTHVSPFHVPAGTRDCLPLYKGEEIDQLIPLDYLPTRGPSNRTPFLAPSVGAATNGQQRSALAELQRISALGLEEHGFVLHEVAKFRVPRRIAGTYFERGGRNRKSVFPHTLWVAKGLSDEMTKGLLGLLTSLPVNFAYHFCATNNHVATNLLACLPVPADTAAALPRIAARTSTALAAGHSLLALFDRLGVGRGRALRTGKPELDPMTFLVKKGIVPVSATVWVERGWFRLTQNGGRERYTVGTLFERGQLVTNGVREIAETLDIWISAYRGLRWRQFEALQMPDDPAAFLGLWQDSQNELSRAIVDRDRAQDEIDCAVADLYRIPDPLREVLRYGPPWLAGRTADDELVEAEEEHGI